MTFHPFCCARKGSCVLLRENLSWSYFNYNRNCTGGCSFKKIWKKTCLLCSCNAMLVQWLLFCQHQYVSFLKFNFVLIYKLYYRCLIAPTKVLAYLVCMDISCSRFPAKFILHVCCNTFVCTLPSWEICCCRRSCSCWSDPWLAFLNFGIPACYCLLIN